jgi:type IV pilus assembly protein PilM
MALWNQIARLVTDPPPNHLFEVSEAGIAFARGKETSFEAFEPGTVVVSPVEDNILRTDAVTAAIASVTASKTSRTSGGSAKKRKPAAVILPDYAARVTVLDFDSFPSSLEEQNSLVRFRVKKTIPFDIDSAAVSHHVQPHPASKKVDVIAVTVSMEVIARYEALFRGSGFQPGVVTTSALAALNLYHINDGEGVAVLAKLSGRALTVSVISSNIVKLFRCVALEEASEEEILGVLHPTFAYVEDELGSPVSRLITCGIPHEILGRLGCEVEPLRSRFGAPGPYNAGLLGYLESVEN